jgi:GT2 family glycosyltransferase
LNDRVSVVIATYSRYTDLQECLQSVFDLRVPPYEVIVVDSDSQDGTEKLRHSFPIKFMSIRDRNSARARNLGISIADGEVVAFLDDDVVVDKDWVNQITRPYVNDRVGGVGGRVIPYGTHAKSYVETGKNDVGRVFSNGLVIGNFDLPSKYLIKVDSFIGCNMSFRRKLLVKAGGFDENYAGTSYRDDTDLCIRIHRLGYALVYDSKALVWHKYRGKRVSGDWSYWYVRNHVYFYLKNLFAEDRLKFPMFLYSMLMPPRDYVLKSGTKIKVEPKLVLNVFKGLYDGYKIWRRRVTQDQLMVLDTEQS